MGHINYTLKKLLLCFTVIVLTVVINNNFVFTTNAQAGTHTIFGFIEYGNGEPTPNDVTVVLTDPGKGSTTVQTFTEAGVTGFYYIDDIYIILGTDDKPGDEMDVSVDYGGCTGSETFTAKQEGTDKIDITITGNLPPNIPDQPTGSSSGYTHISYNFSTKTTDQDAPADQVKYGWDWDGDSVVDDWTGLYDSNETCTISHIWNSAGTCSIKVKAQDEHGAEKGVAWSDTFDVTISNILPVADFTYSPSSPTTSDTVSFYDNSSDENGQVESWSWTFGDNENSTSRNATHRYYNPGSYQVILTVTDDDGDDKSKSTTITVTGQSIPKPPPNKTPIASFTYTPSNPVINDTINFVDTSTDTDGTIVSWSWSFGDGTSSTLQNPSHIYNESGDHLVSLTVTDNDNSSNTIQKNVEIIPIYDETDENISDINLNYNSKNKGKNYIVWKGTAVNASELAISTQLSTGESISIFDSNTGVWREYIVGSSGLAQDFLISTFDVIIITCKSQKSIALDVSQQNNDYPSSITLSYNYNLNTKTGNPGVNFLIWPVNTTIRCRDLANRVSLLYGYTIHKYDNELGKWSSFVVGVDIEDPSFNYTVSKFDILCIYVEEEKILTLS